MKKRFKYSKTILIILGTVFVLGSSCRKQLDKIPLTNFSNEGFWINETNTLLALTGVYRGNIQMSTPNYGAEFSPTDWWSYYGLLTLEFATDNAYDRRGDNSQINKLTDGTLVATNNHVSAYWSLSYARIARANYFLENVDKAPIAADLLKRVKAEARFIRATQYFYLAQYWGSVPLVQKTLSLQEANTVTKSTEEAIIKFAADELTAAARDLPQQKDIPASERGRASTQAALAFLGRLQLGAQQFASAAATYKSIIDLNDNIIDPDFAGLFLGTNESSREIIFATQYLPDQAPNAMAQHFFPAMVGGWHLHNPLGSLVESFEFSDGTPFSYSDPRYNPSDIGANRDPRLKYTVLYNQQTFKGVKYITHPDSTNSIDQLTTTKQATRTGYGIKKFSYEGLSGDLQNSGIDIPVIRYAEILLSYLEARLEASEPIDQTLLDATINKVRGRSSVNLPAITETNPDKLRVILRRERRNELALEGIRLWDLLRWGIAGQVLNGDFYGAAFPGAVNVRKKANAIDPYSRWFVTSKAFRSGQDEHWPIPQNEVNINPNLQ